MDVGSGVVHGAQVRHSPKGTGVLRKVECEAVRLNCLANGVFQIVLVLDFDIFAPCTAHKVVYCALCAYVLKWLHSTNTYYIGG